MSAHPSNDPPDVVARFEEHLPLADRLARRYVRRGTADDVRQVARLGLLLAARRYDPDAGVFVRYATVTIVGELKKHLRRTDWALHVPRTLQEDALVVTRAVDDLTVALERPPTASEVADHLSFSTERVVEALQVQASRHGRELPPVERSAHTDDLETALLLEEALDVLDDDQRALIELRYGEGLTQEQIGVRIGISQPQVHRRISAALSTMRARIEAS